MLNGNENKSEAWHKGWEDYFADRGLNENPYEEFDKEHADWANGFLDASERPVQDGNNENKP